jgi:hypothetical protein
MFELKINKITRISGTHYVALPPEWLKNYSLKRRDEIRMLLDERGLLVLVPVEAKNEVKKAP